MTKMYKGFLFAAMMMAASQTTNAQCINSVAPTSIPNYQQATDGLQMGNNNNRIFTGVDTFNSLTMNNGSKLYVFGNLRVENFSFNNGTIIIANGATLTINATNGGSFNINNNGEIQVFGRLNINKSVNLNGGRLYINDGDTVNTYGNPVTVSSGADLTVKPLAVVEFGSFTVTGGRVCTGLTTAGQAVIHVKSFTNSTIGGLFTTIASSSLVIHVTDTFKSTSSISISSLNVGSVNICLAATATVLGSPQMGTATQSTNCSLVAPALPITLTAFDAYNNKGMVLLSWNVQKEDNFSHFEIEKSNNGAEWTKLATIASTHSHDYRYNDEANGRTYYRLKLVDNDGKFTYSPVRSIIADGGVSGSPIAFNINGYMYKTVKNFSTENTELNLVDVNGRNTYSQQITNGAILSLNNLPAGIYLAVVKQGNTVDAVKVLLQ